MPTARFESAVLASDRPETPTLDRSATGIGERQGGPSTGLDRPKGVQEVEASRIFRKSAHEGGQVVSPTHRPPLPPQQTSLCRARVIVRQESTISRIEPATFRLVARCLNQLRCHKNSLLAVSKLPAEHRFGKLFWDSTKRSLNTNCLLTIP